MAATIKSHFEEITECSVCACIYADPRTLPCLHTFCLKCIEAWARNRTDAGEKVECPICRKDFSVPDGGGVGDLPKNFAMNNLVELLRDFPDTASASVEVSDQPCQLCSRVADSASGADVAVAASHCTECCIEICAACAEEHMTESCHEVVSRLSKGYSRRNTDHSNVKVFSNYCDRHSKKLLKFYCFDCKSTICASCITANGADDLHAGHKFCDVGKAAYQFRQQMASDLNCMAEGIDICYRLLEHLADDRDSFLERVTEIEMDIHETADRLTKEIARQKVELLTELTAVKERKLSEVEIVFQSIEGLRVMIENYKKFTEDLSAYGTPVEIAQKADYVHSKLDEHLKFDDILCDFNNWGSVDVALEKSELAENSSSFQLAKMNVIKQVGFGKC
jgi:hypothetical protein